MVNRFFDWLFTIPKYIGLIFAVIFIFLYHAGSLIFGYSIIPGWIYLFLLAGGLVTGLPTSLIIAFLVSVYVIYAIPDDPSLVAQVCTVSFLLALLVGYYHSYQFYLFNQACQSYHDSRANEEAANLLTSLNGNVDKVKKAREDVLAIMSNDELSEETKIQLRDVVHTLGNLEQATAGWQALNKVRENILTDKLEISNRIRMSRRNPLGN